MKVLTVKSTRPLEEPTQLDVHYSFGMEQHTDYVFKAKGDQCYSSTIVLEETDKVISKILEATASFPDREFVIDDLDMESNSIDRYRIGNGKILEKLQTGWEWGTGR